MVPSNEKTSFQPPSMVCISVIIQHLIATWRHAVVIQIPDIWKPETFQYQTFRGQVMNGPVFECPVRSTWGQVMNGLVF